MADRASAAALGALLFGAADFGFFALAGPEIDAELALGGDYPWLFSAHSFAFAAALLPAGAAVRRWGAGAVGRTGSLAALAGLGVCLAAGGPELVLAGRVLEGLGAAALMPAAWASIAAAPRARSHAMAASGAAISAGFAAGVLAGGAVATALGWRAASGVVCALLLPAAAGWLRSARDGRARVDPALLAGAAALPLLAIGLATLGGMPAAGLPAVAAGSALGAWAARSRRDARPLSPSRGRHVARCLAAAVTASGVGATVLLGRALIDVGGHGALGASLVLAGFGVAAPAARPAAALLLTRRGAGPCALAGLVVQAAGLGGLAASGLETVAVGTAMLVAGFGHALANAGVADAVVGTGAGDAASDGALLAAAQYLGGGLGALIVLGVAGDPLTRAGAAEGLAVATGLAGAGIAAAALAPLAGQRRPASQRARTRA